MPLCGLAKRWNKICQYLTEKWSHDAVKTKMDEDFIEMEMKVDLTLKALLEIIDLTKEYLQPNPIVRAELNNLVREKKVKGSRTKLYIKKKLPQVQGILGLCMDKYGNELGPDSYLGTALREVGETFKQLSKIKDTMDSDVQIDFLDPMQQFCDSDIKEAIELRKKLQGRRLDYDYKRKKGARTSKKIMNMAEKKLQESVDLADRSMHNILYADIEQVRQLSLFVEAQYEYHRDSADLLQNLLGVMKESIRYIETKKQKEHHGHRIMVNTVSGREFVHVQQSTLSVKTSKPVNLSVKTRSTIDTQRQNQ